MRTSLSSAELALLRTRPSNSRFYLAVSRPPVVLLAGLGTVPNNYPGSVIQLTGIASGVIGDVKAGMTVRLGTSPNQSDLGMLRVRKTSTGTTLQTQEYGSGLVNFQTGACVTIMEDYPILPIHKNYASATSQWTLDLDPYTNQLSNYGPLALLGPPHVGFMDGGKMTASYVGDRSYSLTPGASITSQSWVFPDGQTVTSKLGSSLNPVVMTFTNASSGGRYHTLTVTDGNGNSHIGQRLTFAFNTSAGEPHRVYFDNITGGLRQGGYRTRVYVYGSGASNNFPDGAQVVIFEKASYGTAGSSVGGNAFGRNNIVMVGWIAQESTRIEPFTGETSFEIETIDGVLQKTAGYDIFLESGSAASAWDMASGLTLDRAAVALVKYYSTIANVVDFNLASGTGMTNEIPYRSLPLGSLWSQLTTNYDGMLGIVASDLQSSIYAQEDAQINGGSANLPVVMAITKGDRRDTVTVEHEHRNTRSLQRLYAVMGGTTSPIGAQSPATWQGAFGTIDDRTGNLTAPTQDTLVTWAGNKYAADNNPYKRVVIPLAGNMRIDPVPQCRVTMSLSGNESVRDITWNNKALLPNELSINYDARSGFVNTELVAETSVNGIGGSSLTYPKQSGLVSINPIDIITPPISVPPGNTRGDGNTVYVVTSSLVARTRNFLATSPNYSNLTGSITGTVVDFVLDPFDPKNTAYCLTSAALWKTSTLDSSAPTWEQLILATTYMTRNSPQFNRIQCTIASQGRVYILGCDQNSAFPQEWRRYIIHTHDSGITWSTAVYTGGQDQQAGNDGLYALAVGQHNANVVYVTGSGADPGRVYRSTDGGHSFAVYAGGGSGSFNSASAVHIPYTNNLSDAIIWFWGNRNTTRLYYYDGSSTTTSYSSGGNNTGVTFINVFPTNAFVSDSTIVYALAGVSNNTTWKNAGQTIKLLRSGDNGTTWNTQNTSSGGEGWLALGVWPYDSTQVFLMSSTKPLFSVDSGVTLQDKTGDWATSMGGAFANPVMIVPIWIN